MDRGAGVQRLQPRLGRRFSGPGLSAGVFQGVLRAPLPAAVLPGIRSLRLVRRGHLDPAPRGSCAPRLRGAGRQARDLPRDRRWLSLAVPRRLSQPGLEVALQETLREVGTGEVDRPTDVELRRLCLERRRPALGGVAGDPRRGRFAPRLLLRRAALPSPRGLLARTPHLGAPLDLQLAVARLAPALGRREGPADDSLSPPRTD